MKAKRATKVAAKRTAKPAAAKVSTPRDTTGGGGLPRFCGCGVLVPDPAPAVAGVRLHPWQYLHELLLCRVT